MDSVKGNQHTMQSQSLQIIGWERIKYRVISTSIKSILLSLSWYIAKENGKNGNMRGCTKMVSNIPRKQGTRSGNYIQTQRN
jgi:hypothetical protein